jgi:hypothetical protein
MNSLSTIIPMMACLSSRYAPLTRARAQLTTCAQPAGVAVLAGARPAEGTLHRRDVKWASVECTVEVGQEEERAELRKQYQTSPMPYD